METPPPSIPLTKTKRSRKPATPRVRKPKDPGIIAIEQAAAKQKDEYRKAQASGAILKRIVDKLLPRLTEPHQQDLRDTLNQMVLKIQPLTALSPDVSKALHALASHNPPTLERTGDGTESEASPPYGSPAWAAAHDQ